MSNLPAIAFLSILVVTSAFGQTVTVPQPDVVSDRVAATFGEFRIAHSHSRRRHQSSGTEDHTAYVDGSFRFFRLRIDQSGERFINDARAGFLFLPPALEWWESDPKTRQSLPPGLP